MHRMSLTVTNATLDGDVVNVRVAGDTIEAIGADVSADPADDLVDAGGMALVRPLVNGHTHAAMTLFRGFGSDLQLQEWLQDMIWPAEARLTDDDCYWGTRLAALEMVRSGTTHFFDMYWHPGATARAARDAGIRATVGAPLFDGGNADGLASVRSTALESLDELADAGPLVTASLTPHAIYTVSEPSLKWVAETAAERDLLVHIHFCETIRECDDWKAQHDETPTDFLDRIGLLRANTILAHGCVLDDVDLETIADRGATIVTNPVSNLKLANGRVFPYPAAARHGVPVGLGTDGASSNNSLDLLSDLKVFSLVQKHDAFDPTTLPAGTALEIAQGRQSNLLPSAALEPGAPADFLLVDTSLPEMNPGELIDNLVYAATGDVVDTTVVAGRVVMRHRQIDGADEVVAEARRCAERVLGQTG
jgi:5-methylthioadenosine/S-adenosylhomocysteine deaminase